MNLINESTPNNNKSSTNNTIVNFYEQLLHRTNIQQQSILTSPNNNSTKQYSSSNSSTSSLLSTSKSQQSSPKFQTDSSNSSPNNNDEALSSPSCPSTPLISKTNNNNDFENKYKAYMMNAAAMAAAAAAASVFPYNTMIGFNHVPNLMIPPPPPPMINFHQKLMDQKAFNFRTDLQNNHNFLMQNYHGLIAAAAVASQNQNNTIDAKRPNEQQSTSLYANKNTFVNNDETDQEEDNDTDELNGSVSNTYRGSLKNEDPKPAHSYIGLIALAILSSPEKRLVLSDIYQWILDNYSYFHTRGSGWRNSIRHNLSLNDCFMKCGRSSNGKGHYWTIHPANLEDFSRGDFRRRRAQRRVRKSLGLTVPEEDEEDDDLLTPPSSLSPVLSKIYQQSNFYHINNNNNSSNNNHLSSNSSCSSANSFNNDSHIDLRRVNHSISMHQNNYNYEFLNKGVKRDCIQNREDVEPKLIKFDQMNESYYNQLNFIATLKEHQQFLANLNSNNNNQILSNSNEIYNKQNDVNHKKVESCDSTAKKRSFNVDSLLAPEQKTKKIKESREEESNKTINDDNELKTKNNNDTFNENSSSSFEDCEKSEANISIDKSNVSVKIENEVKKNIDEYEQNNKKIIPNNKLTNSPNKNRKNFNQLNTNRTSHHHSHFSHNYQHGYNSSLFNQHNSPFSKVDSNNEDVEKWKQTFSKIMARSYKNNPALNTHTNKK